MINKDKKQKKILMNWGKHQLPGMKNHQLCGMINKDKKQENYRYSWIEVNINYVECTCEIIKTDSSRVTWLIF